MVWYRWDLPSDGFIHAMFTRLGGVSRGPAASLNLGSTVGDDPAAVRENHRRALGALGIPPAWVSPHQVHGSAVAVVGGQDKGSVVEATDALITGEPGVPLLLRFADCVPVLFFDAHRRVAGIAHAGWRGVAAGIVPATVAALVSRFGCRPVDVWAGIGPSIGPDHYEVGDEVCRDVTAAVPDGAVEVLCKRRDGRVHLDLPAAIAAQLAAAGVTTVDRADICTACNTTEWFSHRAEAGATGRFGVLVMLT